MLRIGLTGGIGSGKSTVARIFETLGVPVFYADAEARRLLDSDEMLMRSIQNAFGEESYVDGRYNIPYMSAKVFADPSLLERLNALVHPRTIAAAEEWMTRQSAPYAMKEAALIFESGSEKHLDRIIGVTAPEALRIRRVMQRDGLSREQVIQRINRQMDETRKMERCDYLIRNDEEEPLLPQVLTLHEILLEQRKNK